MSQSDYQTFVVDGDTYKIGMLDPFTAFDMVHDLAKILGPSLAALASGYEQGEGDSADVKGEQLEKAITAFVQNVSREKQREFVHELAKITLVVKENGAEPSLLSIYPVHFRGRLAAQYKWFGAALKSQFWDFFSQVIPAIGAAVQKAGLAA